MKYQPVIGLEIHAELKTKTKMFCNSLNDPLEQHPNVNICPVCAGQPGALPVINKEAVRKVLMVGLALDGKIAETSYFDRKNYFYPDLPKGYQISQYKCPLVEGGRLNKVRITRIHLEEDTGKLVHREGENYSLIDFNRAGVPLMELVTEPAIASSGEARAFAEELQLLLKYLGVSDADMEKGQMRVEVNISLQSEISDSKLGTKVEVKNLNSFRSVERAIEYEIKRQTGVLEEGKKVIQETRGWDEKKQKTFSQRQKEESHDYRYFPEPDLPSLKLEEIEEFKIENLKRQLPELPWQKRERLAKQYGLKDNLDIFIRDKALADYFENIISEILAWEANEQKEKLIKLASNYLLSDLQGILKEKSASFDDILITPENFAELMKMIAKNEISSRVAKDVLKEMFGTGVDPTHIVGEKGLSQVSDEAQLEKIVGEIIKKNPQAVEDYKKGKGASLQFLLGQIMRQTRGAANPEIIRKLLVAKIQ